MSPSVWIRIACPVCAVSVEVHPGARAWCIRCTGRPELTQQAAAIELLKIAFDAQEMQ